MKKPVLNMIDTPINSKSKKSYHLIGRKVRILLMYLPEKKKRNDIHTDMQYIIKNVIYRLKRRKL